MAEYTQFFLRKARQISEILQFFRGILAQNWRDLDAARLLLSHLNAEWTWSRDLVPLDGLRIVLAD